MRQLLARWWKWYRPRPLDEALAEALYRGLRHDEAVTSNKVTEPYIVAPGAFDHLLPAEVPLTDAPGGNRIGTAKVTKDNKGLVVSMTLRR